MTDPNPSNAPLDYVAPKARRQRDGVIAIAIAAIVVGVAGTIVATMSTMNVVMEWRTDEALIAASIWQNRTWFAAEVTSLLSSMMMTLGGIALLRRSSFVWNAAVAYTILSLAASLMLVFAGLLRVLNTPVELTDERWPLELNNVTTPAGWAVFEVFVLVLLVRGPVRRYVQRVSCYDSRRRETP